MTKQALIGKALGAGAQLAGKGALWQLERTGKFVAQHPRLSLASTLGATGAAVGAAEGIRRSEAGLSAPWLAARRAGYVNTAMPEPAEPRSRFNFLANRSRLIRQMGL